MENDFTQRQSGNLVAQDEDDDTTFTQPSTSQVQRGLEKLTPAQVDQKVRHEPESRV